MLNFDKIAENNILIAFVGPTGSGKSNLALQLAEYENIEIISADSRQVFKYLDIGTAKPNIDEQNKVKHHLIDIIEPNEYFSAGEFENDADKIYNQIIENGKIPVLVGGSGLYINAMVNGIFDEDAIFEDLSTKSNSNSKHVNNNNKEQINFERSKIKEKLVKRFERYGIYDLYLELEDIDPVSAKKYEDKNPVRVIRALEFYYLFNRPISEFHVNSTKNKYKVQYFQIDIEREKLYEKINKRTDIMFELGWIDEVKKILGMGYDYKLNSLNTVGYKEIIDYLDEDSEFYADKDYMIDKVKQKTRNYAKRQITWFKKYAMDSNFVNSLKDIELIINKI